MAQILMIAWKIFSSNHVAQCQTKAKNQKRWDLERTIRRMCIMFEVVRADVPAYCSSVLSCQYSIIYVKRSTQIPKQRIKLVLSINVSIGR